MEDHSGIETLCVACGQRIVLNGVVCGECLQKEDREQKEKKRD